jgi:diacylglycerol kinase (ATP)
MMVLFFHIYSMAKNIFLLHNPASGHGQHTKEELISIIEEAGYNCNYASIKEKGWKDIPSETEWIAVAGGDGTVKKIIQHLHDISAQEKYPVALIPLGTANNIAVTLGISKIIPDLVKNWGKNFTAFDTGTIGYGDKKIVFGEGIGFGLFPDHVVNMTKKKAEGDTPQERLANDKDILLESAKSYQPFPVEIQIEGKIYKGEYLMVEVLNIRSIGPNLVLSPGSDPGDGLFEIILVGEKDRPKLVHYLTEKMNGREIKLELDAIPVKRTTMLVKSSSLHVDDEIMDRGENSFVSVVINKKQLQFLT